MSDYNYMGIKTSGLFARHVTLRRIRHFAETEPLKDV